jgi:anti-anti-sigma factor
MQQALSLQGFEASVSNDGVVHAAGEIDSATAPLLRDRLTLAAESTDTDLIVDLADVTYMDLRGLYVLVDVSRQLEADGRRPRARRPPPIVRRLSELASLDGFSQSRRAGYSRSTQRVRVRLVRLS